MAGTESCPKCGAGAERHDHVMSGRGEAEICRACGHMWSPDGKPLAPELAKRLQMVATGLSGRMVPLRCPGCGGTVQVPGGVAASESSVIVCPQCSRNWQPARQPQGPPPPN